MKLSIILPLCDLRDAFERPLASLLNQRLERARYEVVVVIPERDKHVLLGREPFTSLLSRCDQVIFVDADPDAPDSEIVFYSEGSEKATGDLLFFVEGHTVILPGACSAIYDHFSANPRCLAAWGRRLNHNVQSIGKLVGMHNTHHENAAKGQGWFTLGANSVIRKSVLSELGGFEPVYGRFNETILFEKLMKRGTVVEPIDAALSLHYNDMSVAHLRSFLWRWEGGERATSSRTTTEMPVIRGSQITGWPGWFAAGVRRVCAGQSSGRWVLPFCRPRNSSMTSMTGSRTGCSSLVWASASCRVTRTCD